jgi:uncharacterized protein DUF3592
MAGVGTFGDLARLTSQHARRAVHSGVLTRLQVTSAKTMATESAGRLAVSWAERWAKAKENHARVGRLRAGTRVFVLGAILAGAGGTGLYSDAKHQSNGKPSTATLMEHIKECTMEYQRVGEEKRNEKWPCELAEELQRRVGKNKIKISADYFARVQFPLADGRTHEANVDDIKLGTYSLAIGSTVPVFYAPDNPGDVRAKMSWEQVKIQLIMFVIGLACLALVFAGPLATLFGRAFGGRASRAGEETVSAPFSGSASRDTTPSSFAQASADLTRQRAEAARAGGASFGLRRAPQRR